MLVAGWDLDGERNNVSGEFDFTASFVLERCSCFVLFSLFMNDLIALTI